MNKRYCALLLVICLIFTGCSYKSSESVKEKDVKTDDAKLSPFGKYPELVTYTLGKMSGVNNSNMPEGDTYENNAYTRYLKEKLNVQNKDVFEIEETGNYSETVSMAIASDNMPDVFQVMDYNTLQMLVKNDLIEDLTESFEKCTTKRIKDIYNSYGDKMLSDVTFDGKLMAFPGTNIDNGPSFLWLRKDWLDKLHLKEPETIEDVCRIVKEFIKKDPGNNGKGETVGLACNDNLTGGSGYSEQYQMDIIFAKYNAYPRRWIKNKDGEIVYGTVEPQVKKALKKLRSMYEEGIIDNDFILRGDNNIINLVAEGKCGAFFGPWWSPNNPLMQSKINQKEAEWVPYLIQTDKDGNTSFSTQNPSGYYIVVRKGYKHPEIVAKIISVLFDDNRYDREEIAEYYQDNVDPTARPLAVNVDFRDSLSRCYMLLCDALEGKIGYNDLPILEGAYYKSCNRYENSSNPSVEDWAAYTSRIKACSLMDKSKLKSVESLFYGETESMKEHWWKLQELEKETLLAIVTGDKPISYFDRFVDEWYESGGKKITEEVEEYIEKRKPLK